MGGGGASTHTLGGDDIEGNKAGDARAALEFAGEAVAETAALNGLMGLDEGRGDRTRVAAAAGRGQDGALNQLGGTRAVLQVVAQPDPDQRFRYLT